MKEKLVIIGANEFQNPLILKAKKLGYETHVFAWKSGDIGEETADHFYPISITEKEEILAKCREIEPVGVCTIASDLANITVQYLAKQLGLTHNSDRCIYISTNKYLMRQAFKDNGIPTPAFYIAGSADDIAEETLNYPVIVKPTDRSGSRAITKVEGADELKTAIENAIAQSFEKKAIIEEFIEGDEYSFESISYEGVHTNISITKKFTTGAPNFIETGHVEPSGLSDGKAEEVRQVIFAALDALDIKYGASHAEFRITPEGDVRIIEIGSRMGGDCIGSDLVYLSTGYDFVKMVIDVACGRKPEIKTIGTARRANIRFLFDRDDIAGLEKRKSEQPESIYRISKIEMSNLGHTTDSGSRLGYYIYTEAL